VQRRRALQVLEQDIAVASDERARAGGHDPGLPQALSGQQAADTGLKLDVRVPGSGLEHEGARGRQHLAPGQAAGRQLFQAGQLAEVILSQRGQRRGSRVGTGLWHQLMIAGHAPPFTLPMA